MHPPPEKYLGILHTCIITIALLVPTLFCEHIFFSMEITCNMTSDTNNSMEAPYDLTPKSYSAFEMTTKNCISWKFSGFVYIGMKWTPLNQEGGRERGWKQNSDRFWLKYISVTLFAILNRTPPSAFPDTLYSIIQWFGILKKADIRNLRINTSFASAIVHARLGCQERHSSREINIDYKTTNVSFECFAG